MSELWAIGVALPHEAKGIVKQMSLSSQTQFGKFKIYEGELGKKRCLLFQTGMGPQNASEATKFLLSEYPVTHLLSTGYCGALVAGIQNGDAVLATSLCSTVPEDETISTDSAYGSKIKKLLDSAKIPLHLGRMVTSERPVLEVHDKEKLGQSTRSIAVDMESYSVLKVANASKKITSLVLRFVVDALHTDLAYTDAFVDASGGFQPLGLAREVIRRPKVLTKLPGLERLAGRARKTLLKSVDKIFSSD